MHRAVTLKPEIHDISKAAEEILKNTKIDQAPEESEDNSSVEDFWEEYETQSQ